MKKLYSLMVLTGLLLCGNIVFGQASICSITISSGAGTDAQTVCINNPILDITYNYVGSSTAVPVATGLPNGLTFSFADNTCIISGTPTEAGTFNYSVGLSMANCINGNPHATGTITVNPRPETIGVNICPGGTGSLSSPTDCTTTNMLGPKDAGLGYNEDGSTSNFHTAVGTVSWDSPENITQNNSAGITLNPHDTSIFLSGHDYHFNIPGDAIITGITVEIGRICSFTGSPSVQDYAVVVYPLGPTTLAAYAGPPVNKAQVGIDWGSVGFQSVIYGGPGDTWGRAWTPAEINGQDFGAALAVINANGSNPITVSVDYIKISVSYTIPGLIKWYTVSAFGSPIGTGSSFNPVGVLNAGLPNTNTPGTTSFYAECNSHYNCRTQTDFVIKALPNIVIQPVSTATCTGGTASFNVVAVGTDLIYQWYKGSAIIDAGANPSAGTSTLILSNVQPGDVGDYTVVISSLDCPVTSAQATLTVNEVPTASITNNGNSLVCVNAAASVTLTGSGGTLPYTFTYSITNDNPNTPVQTITTASGSINLAVQTSMVGSFHYNLIAVSDNNGCTNSIPGNTTITIIQGAQLTSPSTASVCSDSFFNYTVLSSPSNAGISWFRILPAGITSSLPGSGTNATINDVLHNDGYLPAIVKYVITLAGVACNATDTLFLTVNPTPVINAIAHPDTLCNGSNAAAIIFSSNAPDSVISWTCTPSSIGFGVSGNGSVSSFIATNTTDQPVTVTVTVSINASNIPCPGADSSFTITVLPTPYLTSGRDTAVCNNTAFIYTASSSADLVNAITNFSWARPAVPGISNAAGSGSSNIINEIIPLNNTTAQPVLVKYIFTLSIGTACTTTDTLKVIVNPSATVNPVADFVFCNADPVNGITFNSPTATGISYAWTCIPSVGFGENGTGNIPPFFASSDITVDANVSVTAIIGNCPGTVPTTFTIRVNPSPPDPDFNWLALHESICKGSSNINFNIISPENTVLYVWRPVPANDPGIIIRDSTAENTVITFLNPGNKTIEAMATSAVGCTNTHSRIVKINETEGIEERKIFRKQPGNLLIYPDNGMNGLNGYQWGYDSVLRTVPDTAYSTPLAIDGQVYQFFVPAERFIVNNELDTVHYAFWVLLQDGDCYSRVYYNGPYSNGRMQFMPQEDYSVQMNLFPNPNNGIFDVVVKGDIYGTMEAKIYNSAGQLVFTDNFKKITAEINHKINLKNIPNGSYYLLVKNSDLKKLKAGFVIQNK